METIAPTIHRIENWLSANEYAKECGIQTRSVYLRHKRGVITSRNMDGRLVVDVRLSPPATKIFRNAPRAAPFAQVPGLPPFSKLVQVRNFCKRKNIRGHDLYRDIMLGLIPAWCFAERVFIERTSALDAYIGK